MDQAEARKVINQKLREEGTHYTFETLHDRFRRAYYDAIEDGDDIVTVKIPSSYEMAFRRSLVRKAL